MPWTSAQFNKRHLGGKATKAQATRGAAAANAALSSCLKKGGQRKKCEGYAVRVGKAIAKRKAAGQEMSKETVSRKQMRRQIFADLQEATWGARYINDLPDSAFLYVESGEKDSEGKTTPRKKRHLPYKDKSGKVDLAHLRNALSRLGQSGTGRGWLSEDLRKRLASKARGILARFANVRG